MHHPTRILATLLCVAAPLSAQGSDGAYWNEYALPANYTQFRSIGTLAMFESPTAYHLYSGLHRRWVVQPVAGATTLGTTNRYTLFQDGTTIHGFSSVSGRVASLATSGSATVNIGSASSSWTAYVVDGGTVHGWSGFYGSWQPLVLQGGLQAIGIGSHMITCVDGQGVHAFSAFHGTWVSTPLRTGFANVSTWRNGALATFTAPDEVRGFSAYRNAWVSDFSFAQPDRAQFVGNRDGYAYLGNGGTDVLWFSALAGVFSRSSDVGGLTLHTGPNCAIVASATGIEGYAPSTGALLPLPPSAAPPTILMASGSFGAYGLIDDGSSVTAFSGLTGRTAAMPFWLPWAFTLGDTAAFATTAGGVSFGYSALRDQWVQAPTDPSTDIRPQFESILRVTTNGVDAFSARTGTFASTASIGTVAMLNQGAIAAVVDGDSIEVFDPTLCRWIDHPTGPAPSFGVHRLVGVGRDGTHLHGYSLFTNTWESIPYQGTFVSSAPNSSIGYAQTTSHVYVFTGNGSLSNHSRFPEFSRFATIGAPFVRLQCGNPGAFVFGLFAFASGETFTPYGVLRVDPNPIVMALGAVPADGLLRTALQIPNDPWLHGLQFHMQDLLLQPNGTLALSNAQSPYLW